MQKWKQKLGSSATYNNLIGVFERAGYQGYADVVRGVCGNTSTLTTPPVTQQPIYKATQALVQESVMLPIANGDSPNKSQGLLDESSADELFSTPPTTPIPPQDDHSMEVRHFHTCAIT